MWSSGRERDYLFSKYDMYGLIEAQKNAVTRAAEELPDKRVKQEAMEVLAAEIAAKLTLEVPVLDEQNITVSRPTEVEVEVRDSYGFSDGRRVVQGMSVTFTVPFTGEHQMFFVRPNSYDSAPPMGDVATGELQYAVTAPQLDAAQIKSEFERFLASVKKYLGWQKENVSSFNKELEQLAARALVDRKRRLVHADDIVGSLGYKVR